MTMPCLGIDAIFGAPVRELSWLKQHETTRMVDATIVSGREREWSESRTQRQNFRAPPGNNCVSHCNHMFDVQPTS